MSEETTPPRWGPVRPLWGMIVRPRATLTYLTEYDRRSWWLPALLAVILIAAPIVAAAPITARATHDAVLAAQEQMAEQRGTPLTPEEQQQLVSYAASPLITTVFPAAAGVGGALVGWLVWAGALYLAGMVFGGRNTFGTMFRTVVWVWLPFALRGLIQTAYILFTGQLIANPGLSGFLSSAPATEGMLAARPSVGQIVLQSLLGRIDIFTVWNLVLLVLGVRVVTQLSWRKAALVTVVVWLLLTALSLGPAVVSAVIAARSGF